MNQAPETLLEIKGLKTHFFLDEGVVKAVDGVSLSLYEGKTLGVVGESGCGKSVTAQSILQISGSGSRIVDGEILFRKDDTVVDLAKYGPMSEEIRRIRGASIAMIFQEPSSAFSPVYTIGRQLSEALLVHRKVSKAEARARVIELLSTVGINMPEQRFDAYPFELSGGMRQRAMIAMALICNPSLLIADEPTTALDVTIQAQILDLMKRLQSEFGMSIMLITHNMAVIAEMADTVAVLYLGKVVESAPVWELFDNPSHPYTQALLRSIPKMEGPVADRLESIKGGVPDPYHLPEGCRFHPRCKFFMPGVCDAAEPPQYTVTADHTAACFLLREKP
ncbi:MAG: ABC transporter ATP-binding protein [Chloroflexi bacterium]|nr:ABC transporter ATP-binding protein [Chloroflexota bacterium]